MVRHAVRLFAAILPRARTGCWCGSRLDKDEDVHGRYVQADWLGLTIEICIGKRGG